jgi:hypothetical protein
VRVGNVAAAALGRLLTDIVARRRVPADVLPHRVEPPTPERTLLQRYSAVSPRTYSERR